MATKKTSPLDVTVTSPAPLSNIATVLAERRDNAAITGAQAYGANTEYAKGLIEAFGQNFWRKASPSFKAWQEEKARFDESLKARKHPNPSQAQTRLIQKADELCNGKKGKGEGVTLVTRAIKEACALYRAMAKEEEKVGLDAQEQRILDGLITYMTGSLKLDLNNLPKA